MSKHPAVNQISPQELNQLMKDQSEYILIDTLLSDQYQKVHLPAAENACVFQVDFLAQIERIVSNKKSLLILYGARPETLEAQTAAEKLSRAGYQHLAILQGGLAGWQDAGFTLEGDRTAVEPVAFRLPNGTFLADLDKTTIQWTGRNPSSEHWGSVALSAGSVKVAADQLSGEFTVDMTSIGHTDLAGNELEAVLIDHLTSDDFFFTEIFPSATFTVDQAEKIEGAHPSAPNYLFSGALELRGVKAPLRFPATVNCNEDGQLLIEAHFDLDRTTWGVIYGSAQFFDHLGMHLVFDLISLQVRFVSMPSST